MIAVAAVELLLQSVLIKFLAATVKELNLDQVVITGTKTLKRQQESAIKVNIINSRKLENVQACNIAEGLHFESGLRVETDCQTCNYTQLRINGLAGGYSQILINGKAIFSPLAGLYGLEQIPANMVDRIEIIKGGGSALYGSSAIGGIVNIITKNPTSNYYRAGYSFGNINNDSEDKVFHTNTTILSNNKNSGATIFTNHRERMSYDHNNDNYSEIPTLQNNTFGVNLFFSPSENKKLKINIGRIYEYRYGGEMINTPAHLAMQAEERTQNILLGDINYEINFNNQKSTFSTYLAAQNTTREHFTGVRPEIGTQEDINYLINPPYGQSFNKTTQAGLQLNHNWTNLLGPNIITLGFDYIVDDIYDEIKTYNYLVNQRVQNLGTFIQSDWFLSNNLNLLSGVRADNHSLLNHFVISPRTSLLYKANNNTQFRISYSTGFRAPQAFDTDLHIAFAGGNVSMIQLDDNLQEENSKSLSGSLNYTKTKNNYFYGFAIEGFYTRLNNTFYQEPVGNDGFGEIFIKRNGDGATVQGVNIELKSNIKKKIQFESGITYQKSEYDVAINYSTNLDARKEFLRTPEKYGYVTLDYFINNKFTIMTNLIHTGSMYLVHMAGAPNQTEDQYIETEVFNVIGIKATYMQQIKQLEVKCEYSIGVKNLTNDYQTNFDTSKNRDSNFIYGPNSPRIIYFGIVINSL